MHHKFRQYLKDCAKIYHSDTVLTILTLTDMPYFFTKRRRAATSPLSSISTKYMPCARPFTSTTISLSAPLTTSSPMRKNTCRKDICHPRPVCAPSLSDIGSIPGEDGAHPETGKKNKGCKQHTACSPLTLRYEKNYFC